MQTCASTMACRPSRNNLGQSHENGAIESRQGSLKGGARTGAAAARAPRVCHHCRLSAFRRRGRRTAEPARPDAAGRRAQPARRATGAPDQRVRGDRGARDQVQHRQHPSRALQRALSRLIGHRLNFRLYPERLEGWVGGVCVFEERARDGAGGQAARQAGRLPAPAARAQAQTRRLCPLGAAR